MYELRVFSANDLGQLFSRFCAACWLPKNRFEIGGGELNEGLEKVPLFGVVARRMPEPFEDSHGYSHQ